MKIQKFIKTRAKEAALSSYRNYNDNVLKHHSKDEFLALENLHRNKNIVIQKSDKDKSLVIVDKADYLDKMENLLSNTQKSEKLDLKNDAYLPSLLDLPGVSQLKQQSPCPTILACFLPGYTEPLFFFCLRSHFKIKIAHFLCRHIEIPCEVVT